MIIIIYLTPTSGAEESHVRGYNGGYLLWSECNQRGMVEALVKGAKRCKRQRSKDQQDDDKHYLLYKVGIVVINQCTYSIAAIAEH
jgi:hypothetical protein